MLYKYIPTQAARISCLQIHHCKLEIMQNKRPYPNLNPRSLSLR